MKLNRDTIDRSRELRAHATDHERGLWCEPRELKQIGYHFRGRAPFQSYFLDFVEHGAKLVVELDGSQHGMKEHLAKDERRDAAVRAEGYAVSRFWNPELNEGIEAVIEAVVRQLRMRHPHPKRSALRPPHKGEVGKRRPLPREGLRRL